MDENAQDLAQFISRQQRKRHLAAVWAELAGVRAGMAVLDIGSGPGVLAEEYAKIVGPNGRVYALDPKIAPASMPDNLVFLRQDAARPINLPAAPDVIFITDVLHHAPDPAAILTNLREVCGPQTRMLIAEYDPSQPGLVGAKPARRMAKQALLSLLDEAGFSHGGVFGTADEHYAVVATRQ
jgi:ubiquinone/menaquinone biosynthesis C-methylase UbiE